jgi:hypothetical protein
MAVDYEELAKGIEQLRETLNAMVMALVADGFTDREARAMVAHIMCRTDEDEVT